MKKNSIIFSFLLSLTCISNAQKILIDQQKFIIKLNYSTVTSKSFTPPIPNFNNYGSQSSEQFYNNNSLFEIAGLFNLNKYISTGAYFGYSKETFISNRVENPTPNTTNIIMDYYGNSYFYGLKSELQLLPLLIKDSELRLNIYCPVQLGLVSQQVTKLADNSKSWDKPAFEIGAGIGLSYKFTKNIGVFGEYQVGKFYNNRKSQWKVGVLVTF